MKILTSLVTLLFIVGISTAAEEPILPAQSDERDKQLIQSAFDGDLERVQVLVAKGATVDSTGPKSRTALFWAATNGHTPVVKYLHEAGADINAADSNGRTPLMFAARGSHLDAVEYLLANGADVNVRSIKQGYTALITAAAVGDIEVVNLLLEYGADTTVVDISGGTALDRAREFEHSDIVAILEGKLTSANSS